MNINRLIDVHSVLERELPSLDDTRAVQPLEIYGPANPHIALAHFLLHASTITLYNFFPNDPSALQKALEASYAMAATAKRIRGRDALTMVQAPLALMVKFL